MQAVWSGGAEVNCCECEEVIAAAARDGRTLETAAEHVARCRACWEFAKEMAVVAAALGEWPAPRPESRAIEAARAVLLKHLAAQSQPAAPRRPRALACRWRHPALLALPGAAAAAAGVAMAPEWARVAAACWAATSAALVSVVMLFSAPPTESEGEWR